MREKAEGLKAEIKILELAHANGDIQFNDSRLQQAREAASVLDKRVMTLQRLVVETEHPTEIPVQADSRAVTERFDAVFPDGAPEEEALANR